MLRCCRSGGGRDALRVVGLWRGEMRKGGQGCGEQDAALGLAQRKYLQRIHLLLSKRQQLACGRKHNCGMHLYFHKLCGSLGPRYSEEATGSFYGSNNRTGQQNLKERGMSGSYRAEPQIFSLAFL